MVTERLAMVLAATVVVVAIVSGRGCYLADVERRHDCDRSGGVMVNDACLRVKEQVR